MAVPGKAKTPVHRNLDDWVMIMKQFTEQQKVVCKVIPTSNKQKVRPTMELLTGSRYQGTWDNLGMSGYGTFISSNGVVYTGEIDDGMFNGTGSLEYPNGTVLQGTWDKGILIQKTLTFSDGLEYDDIDWKYCKMPDRRFTIEYENDLQPGGKTFMTAAQPSRRVPDGFFDTGDGFYNPEKAAVFEEETNNIIRAPELHEHKWIKRNCRTAADQPVGPRPELYEQWNEPDPCPEPSPVPAAVSRANKFGDYAPFDSDEDETDFYLAMRKSRTSSIGRPSVGKQARSSVKSKTSDRRAVSRDRHSTRSVTGGTIKARKSYTFRWHETN